MGTRYIAGLRAELTMGIAQFQTASKNAIASLKKIEGQVSATSKIIKATFAFKAGEFAIGAIEKMVHKVTELADAGEKLGDITAAFKQLGGSASSIDQASKAMYGTVGATTLMQIANKGLIKEIPNLNEKFGEMADYAMRFAEATGGEASQALSDLTEALSKAKKKQMESLGIVIDEQKAYKEYALANGIAKDGLKDYGKVLDDLQKREARQIAAQDAMEEKLKTMPVTLKGVAKAHQEFEVALGGIEKKIGSVIDENGALKVTWEQLTETIKKVDWYAVGEGISYVTEQVLKLVNAGIPWLTDQFDKFVRGLKVFQRASIMTGADKRLDEARAIEDTTPLGAGYLVTGGARASVLLDNIEEAQKQIAQEERTAAQTKGLETFKKKIADVREEIAKAGGKDTLKGATDKLAKLFQEAQSTALKKVAPAIWEDLDKAITEEGQQYNKLPDKTPRTYRYGKNRGQGFENQTKEDAEKAQKEAEAAQKVLDTWRDKYLDAVAQVKDKTIGDAFAQSLKDGDWDAAMKELEKKAELAVQEVQRQFDEGLQHGLTQSQIDDLKAAKKAEIMTEGKAKLEEAKATNEKSADHLAKAEHEAFRSAVDFFANEMDRAIDGTCRSLEDQLKDAILAGTATLAGALNKDLQLQLKDIGGVSGMLGEAFNGIVTGTFSPEFEKLEKSLSMNSALIFAGTEALTAVIGASMGANSLNKKTHSEAGTGRAVGSAAGVAGGAAAGYALAAAMTVTGPVGMLIGAAVGSQLGPILGQAIGGMFKHGPQNPDSKARHAFAGWVEEQLKQLNVLSFYDKGGQLQTKNSKNYNFLENRGLFKGSAWSDEMSKWGKDAQQVFNGLGVALKRLNGITDSTGQQIAFMLGKQLGANIDNARLLVMQLGVSFEDLKKAIEESALAGEIRWSEFNASMAGISEAFKPGLAALGALGEAFDELVASGGRGKTAVKGVRDMIVEAGEKGIKSTQQMRDWLIAQGKPAEQVEAIMSQIEAMMKDNKLKSLNDILGLDDVTVGRYVGNMEGLSKSLAAEWEKIGNDIDSLNKKLSELPKDIQSTIKVTAEISDDARAIIDFSQNGGSTSNVSVGAKKMALGGIVSGASYYRGAIAGEAGPEAIMPLRRVNGRLGVSGIEGQAGATVNINIDATNADNGVVPRIKRALSQIEESSTQSAIQAMLRAQSRGVY